MPEQTAHLVISIIERALYDGCYMNPERKIANGLGSSHLHTAKALREELSCGDFVTVTVHGVMGGAWLAPISMNCWKMKKREMYL